METKESSIKAALRAMRVTPYCSQHSGSTTAAAARQLEGRTHYYEEGTCRFFGARATDLSTFADGAVLCAVGYMLPPDGKRRYEAVCFAPDGHVVHRTDVEHAQHIRGHLTLNAARNELYAWRNSADAAAIVRAWLARQMNEANDLQARIGAAAVLLDSAARMPAGVSP